MNMPIPSRSLRRMRKAPLCLGLALACSGFAAQSLATPALGTLEQRLDAHRTALHAQLAARTALVPVAARPAETLVVSNCDDSGAGSLRDAFDAAVSGDTIDLTALGCSVITLTSGALSTSAYDLTVLGPGADLIAIDGSDSDRIIDHRAYGLLTLDGLALRNGSYTYDGPGIYASAAPGGCVLSTGNVSIQNSTLDHCSANGASVFGGAVNAAGSLSLVNSTITGTTSTAASTELSATSYGGVVYSRLTYLDHSTISGATISASSTSAFSGALGGGVFGLYGVGMTDSTVTGVDVSVSAAKIAYAKGGGVASPLAVVLSSSTVSDNAVHGTPGVGPSGNYTYISAIGGGGVYIASIPRIAPPASAIINSTISGNQATVDGEPGEYTVGGGGGVGSWSPQPLAVVDSTVSGNTTPLDGGGLYTRFRGLLMLANATVTDNTAGGAGAGIADNADESVYDLAIDSSIVAGNHSGSGSEEIVTLHALAGAANLITSANVALPAGTLTVDPMLGPLADNGGPTYTHALLPGSPAIDAGSNPLELETDQRGAGFARQFGDTVDIGAYEAQGVTDHIFADGFDSP